MRNFLKVRKLSFIGTLIVGAFAIVAPYINPEITHRQTLMLLALFIIFVIAVDLINMKRK